MIYICCNLKNSLRYVLSNKWTCLDFFLQETSCSSHSCERPPTLPIFSGRLWEVSLYYLIFQKACLGFLREYIMISLQKMRLKIIASLFYKNLLTKSGRIRHLCLIVGLCCNHQNIVLNGLLRISLYSWSIKYGPFRLDPRKFRQHLRYYMK